MRRLRKLWDSPLRFKALLAEASMRLWALSALRFLPVPGRAQWLMRAHHGLRSCGSGTFFNGTSCQEICHAVDIGARFVPGASCLVKAQAGSAMLHRFGYAAEIKIGVLKQSSDLKAHAWVECEGRVVLGATESQFVELSKNTPASRKIDLLMM